MICVIVLDEKTDRQTELARLLEGSGNIRVIISPSLGHAIELCRNGSVDAVIVRHDEPGQDGLALLTKLRSQPPDLPVILLSGTSAPHLVSGAREHHALYVHLPEPVTSTYTALEQVTGIAVDLHRAKQQIASLEKKLEVVGSVTRHDVMNQMTAINGYNDLLLMTVTDPTVVSYLEKEQEAINRIRTQFQFAKEYQNLGVEPPRFQLIRSVIRRAGENFNLKNIRVVETCGNATLCADPLFERAISYLFNDATSQNGQVTEIRIFVQDDARGIVLVFADNGPGIPAAGKDRLFERGYRKNSMWGLFLAREILAVTGITITETGEPGKGTRFEMHIPEERFRRMGESSPT
jgi:signal transduction histidine kinase